MAVGQRVGAGDDRADGPRTGTDSMISCEPVPSSALSLDHATRAPTPASGPLYVNLAAGSISNHGDHSLKRLRLLTTSNTAAGGAAIDAERST